jgi:hypothetical protein
MAAAFQPGGWISNNQALGPINYFGPMLFGLFAGGFNSARGYLIEVTPHLFFGAAELPQASLDLLNGRPALYVLECV